MDNSKKKCFDIAKQVAPLLDQLTETEINSVFFWIRECINLEKKPVQIPVTKRLKEIDELIDQHPELYT